MLDLTPLCAYDKMEYNIETKKYYINGTEVKQSVFYIWPTRREEKKNNERKNI